MPRLTQQAYTFGMTLPRKHALASAALLVLAAALAPARVSEAAEGWIFLGRRSGGEWKPPAGAIGPSVWPLKPGDRLVLRGEALFYSDADCRVIAAAQFAADPSGRRRWMVKAGAEALEVIAALLECPSAGRAQTVWAKVGIPAERLFSVEK